MKCPKCGISANKPRFEKYWFCPACCHSFNEEGRIQVMDRDGNYISEAELNKPEKEKPEEPKLKKGEGISLLKRLYPTLEALDKAIEESGSQARLAKRLGIKKQTIANYKYEYSKKPRVEKKPKVDKTATVENFPLEGVPKVSVWELLKELEELDKRKDRIIEILNKIEVEAV